MLEETVDERFGRQREAFPPRPAALFEAEGDVPIFQRFEAVVRQGNAVDIRGEVGQHLHAGARRLTVGHPRLVPDLGWHGVAEASGS
jgi:hypothetical protein